jgi:hypothetical protein
MRPTLTGVPLLILLGGTLAACGGPVHQTIELSTTRGVAGQPISGNIVIVNLGSAINLSHGCRPGYTVVLANSHYAPVIAWPADCAAGSFVIPTGTTRLPVTVYTRYSTCSQSGSGTSSPPPCLAGDEMPPLPPGTYQARVAWAGQVPLPPASPVTVSLVAGP